MNIFSRDLEGGIGSAKYDPSISLKEIINTMKSLSG
jgi:hypothetical protein